MIIANTYLPLFAQLFMYVSSLANLCRRRSFSPHFTDQEREADKELGQGYTAGNAAAGTEPRCALYSHLSWGFQRRDGRCGISAPRGRGMDAMASQGRSSPLPTPIL